MYFFGILVSYIFYIAIFVVLTYIVLIKANKREENIKGVPLTVEEQIKRYVPEFETEKFIDEGFRIYCDVQRAYSNFELESVKSKITDELYSTLNAKLALYETNGEQRIKKDFFLKKAILRNMNEQNNTVTVTVTYIIEEYNYKIKKETGTVEDGSNNKKMRTTYQLKFRKSINTENIIKECPNCGADIEIDGTEICSYCHTKLITESTKWLLTETRTMDQEYLDTE